MIEPKKRTSEKGVIQWLHSHAAQRSPRRNIARLFRGDHRGRQHRWMFRVSIGLMLGLHRTPRRRRNRVQHARPSRPSHNVQTQTVASSLGEAFSKVPKWSRKKRDLHLRRLRGFVGRRREVQVKSPVTTMSVAWSFGRKGGVVVGTLTLPRQDVDDRRETGASAGTRDYANDYEHELCTEITSQLAERSRCCHMDAFNYNSRVHP